MKRLNKMIQNYRVLTNNKYRLVTNIVIPVVLGIITAVLAEGLMIQFAMFPPIFMILAEICGDYFGIGCICKKNGFGMDFLKTSHDGIKDFEDWSSCGYTSQDTKDRDLFYDSRDTI